MKDNAAYFNTLLPNGEKLKIVVKKEETGSLRRRSEDYIRYNQAFKYNNYVTFSLGYKDIDAGLNVFDKTFDPRLIAFFRYSDGKIVFIVNKEELNKFQTTTIKTSKFELVCNDQFDFYDILYEADMIDFEDIRIITKG